MHCILKTISESLVKSFITSQEHWRTILIVLYYSHSKTCTSCVLRLQKEYTATKTQLTIELEEKNDAIADLSKRLQRHEESFENLCDEVTKVRINYMGNIQLYCIYAYLQDKNDYLCTAWYIRQ